MQRAASDHVRIIWREIQADLVAFLEIGLIAGVLGDSFIGNVEEPGLPACTVELLCQFVDCAALGQWLQIKHRLLAATGNADAFSHRSSPFADSSKPGIGSSGNVKRLVVSAVRPKQN